MKKLITVIALVALISCAQSRSKQTSQSNLIREAVERMLDLHPQSTLQDIYKSCFQDAFGPGHLISDTVAVRQYLQHELAENDYIDTVLAEPTGIDGNYVRMNLLLVKRGEISEAALIDALIASANNAARPMQDEWRQRWHEIVAEIKAMDVQLPNFEADSTMLEKLLSEGKYVMHHSELFGETYHPHYRIVKKSLYDSLTARSFGQ